MADTNTRARDEKVSGHQAGDQSKHHKDSEVTKDKLDDALNKGLEESFPGSDPVNLTQPPPTKHDQNIKRKG